MDEEGGSWRLIGANSEDICPRSEERYRQKVRAKEGIANLKGMRPAHIFEK